MLDESLNPWSFSTSDDSDKARFEHSRAVRSLLRTRTRSSGASAPDFWSHARLPGGPCSGAAMGVEQRARGLRWLPTQGVQIAVEVGEP